VRHLQRCGGKIVSIEVGNYVQQENIRQQAQGNPTASAVSNVIGENDWGRQFVSAKIRLTVERVTRELRSGVFCVKQTPRFVIPKPGSSARNLFFAGSKTADSSRDKPRFEMTSSLGILKLRHYH
jgi:hypothetical protein